MAESSKDAIQQVEKEKFGAQPKNENDAKIVKHEVGSQCITEINTANPSAYKDKLMKGGLMLIKLKPKSEINGKLRLILSYCNLAKTEKLNDVFDIVIDKSKDEDHFDHSTIKKAILLYRYVNSVLSITKQEFKIKQNFEEADYRLNIMQNLFKDNLGEFKDLQPIHDDIQKLRENIEKTRKAKLEAE